ncbi:MAG: Asp-tRNA(Asn)/Glu-tRNA(Gln) amidotransferase subunit GatC [Algisphaera sp.]
MSQTITETDVRQVAKLSRLKLTDQEVTHFTGQLAAVLGYIAKLDELNVDGVEPLAHASDRHTVLRDDVPGQTLDPDTALRNAPDQQDAFFKVPKVLGSGGGGA